MWVIFNLPVIPGEDIGFRKLNLDSESVFLGISHPGRCDAHRSCLLFDQLVLV